MARRQVRHRILVVPLPLQSPPSAGEQREREEATAEPAAAVPSKRLRSSCRLSGAAGGINLPDDIVVWEIFLRLPCKEILRCRAVCRSWRGLTSADNFLLAHHRRQPSLPLVALKADLEHGFSISTAPAQCSPPILGFDDHIRWKLHASCDGLLLVSQYDGSCFTICNPLTRQCAPLYGLTRASYTDYINVAAMYLHRPSGDYRVLYWKRGTDAAYYILHVQYRRSPRHIGIPAASNDTVKVMRRADGMIPKSWNPPIIFRSRLHWDHVHNHGTYIVIFYMVTESFSLMHGPAVTATSRGTCLNDMEGSIGLSFFDDTSAVVQIWELEDYDKEVWSMKYRMQLPSWNLHRFTDAQHMVLSHDGNMLVCYYSELFSYMFHCDSNGNLLEDFMWGPWCTSITGYSFRESLVKHPFFPVKRADRVTQPHFFRML